MNAHRAEGFAKQDAFSHGLSQEFEAFLSARSYAVSTIQLYVGIVKRYDTWRRHPRARRLVIDEGTVALFVHRYQAKHGLRHVHHIQSALGHLLQMLRDRGEMVRREPSPTVIDLALREFASHLRDTCGFAETTCRRLAHSIRRFLESRFGNGPLRLKGLCRDDFADFVGEYARRLMPAAAQQAASALRTYMRYLQLRGICSAELVAAVPTTPCWKLTRLPRTMTEDQLHTLVSSFDRTTAMGRRDYAMVLLMSTLGLRASEVALLKLEDLNWRESSLNITTPKNRRTMTLPLSAETGRAIADYLRHDRPTTPHRHVFARHCAPRQVPLSASTIRAMTVRAYRRCGFSSEWCGTHILRHTVATQLHQRGAALKEVADLLGHRSIETSAIYAKVNLSALAAVAMPWPEATL